MKVYKFTSYIGKEYAILRPSSKENIKEMNLLDVWWDSWGSNGNKIGDFTFCYGIKICKLSVFNLFYFFRLYLSILNSLAGVNVPLVS